MKYYDHHISMSVSEHISKTRCYFYSAASPWLYVVPWGLRRTLCWVKDHYGNPPIFITENGFSDSTGKLDDHCRINYMQRYINEVLKGNQQISANGLKS